MAFFRHMIAKKNVCYIGLFLLILAVVCAFRIRFMDIPLERDEGEYAYLGQLIGKGIVPYATAFNMKYPGMYLINAIFIGLFGQTVQALRLGLMLVHLATCCMVFFLAYRCISRFAGIVAMLMFAVMALDSSVLGFAGHATHYVTLFAMASYVLLLIFTNTTNPGLYTIPGMFMGLSILMKQPGLFFIVPALIICWGNVEPTEPQKARIIGYRMFFFILGSGLPLIIVFVWLYLSGVFHNFWFWTWTYIREYATQVPLSGAMDMFWLRFPKASDGFAGIWAVSVLAALIGLFFSRFLKSHRWFLLAFYGCSLLTCVPGFYFRSHYFICAIPAVAIFTGLVMDQLKNRLRQPQLAIGIPILCCAVLLLPGIVTKPDYYFFATPNQISRNIYGSNPFPEAVTIGRFIKQHTTPQQQIAILGSEPEILFYAQRQSCTSYIYTYGLMEQHPFSLKMQQDMAREIETAMPPYVVFVGCPTSWNVTAQSPRYIFRWAHTFLKSHYQKQVVADIVSPEHTIYKYGPEATTYRIQSPSYLVVYQKLS